MTNEVQQYSTWVPTKDTYTDEEILTTPVFQRIKQDVSVTGPGGKTIQLSDESILPLARDAIREMWNTLQSSRFDSVIAGVFEALDASEVDHGDEVIIRRNAEGICSYKPTKNAGRKRFSHEGYAKLIGIGAHEESDTYKTAIDKLKKAGYNPAKDLAGGFLLVKNQMKNSSKNGVFELVIEEGDEANKLAGNFKATLFQYPDNKAKVPCVVFPPASGDKGKLIVNDDVLEVPSMSRMMKESILQGAQTPAVMFDLVQRLKDAGEDVDAVLEEGEEGSDDAATAPQASKPAQPATKKGAAQKLLDE